MDALNKALSRIPILILALGYCGWQAYDYYDWLNSPKSELGVKKAGVIKAKEELQASKRKLAEGEEFFNGLELLRARIRQLTAQLDATKTTLNSDIDIASFVRMVVLEAKKLGIDIKSFSPEAEEKHEYYISSPYKVLLRGAYVQLLVFFDRIAKFQQVIRISNFDLKPSGNNLTKYVELNGTAKLVAFKYLGTQADDVVNKDEMKGNTLKVPPKPAKGTKAAAAKPKGAAK